MKRLFSSLLLIALATLSLWAQSPRTYPTPPPTRQVHLDFHTSEFIENIGSQFDKQQFQEALTLGKLNQINIFAKGHHSWSYYPTKVGQPHPHLAVDLLGAQIEACHEIGIKCPIYFTVGWSANDAEQHPEWVNRHPDGSFMVHSDGHYRPDARPDEVIPNYTWKFLVPVGGYHDLIMQQVEELCQNYEVDGFWFDIYHYVEAGCYSDECLRLMRQAGVDPKDKQANIDFIAEATKDHMRQLRELIATYYPKATVYFNPTSRLNLRATISHRLFEANTHQDLEDLPTTWEGYDKMPIQAKFHSRTWVSDHRHEW